MPARRAASFEDNCHRDMWLVDSAGRARLTNPHRLPGDSVPSVLTGPEIEEVRRTFAQLRAAAAHAADPGTRDGLLGLSRQLARVVAGGDPEVCSAELTTREIDVLAHAALGYHNDEIADRIGVTAETVKSYLRSAMTRLGVHARFDAVSCAREAGFLP